MFMSHNFFFFFFCSGEGLYSQFYKTCKFLFTFHWLFFIHSDKTLLFSSFSYMFFSNTYFSHQYAHKMDIFGCSINKFPNFLVFCVVVTLDIIVCQFSVTWGIMSYHKAQIGIPDSKQTPLSHFKNQKCHK